MFIKKVAKLNMAKDIEYSMECNPGEFNRRKARSHEKVWCK